MVKVFVGNIQAESCRETESELRHLFEQFGEVTECDILTGKNFGFVHMAKEEEADAAINGLDGAYVFGGNITVEKSANQSRGRNSRGMSRGGGSRGYGRGFGGGGRYRPYRRPLEDPYYSLYDDPYLGYPYPLPRDPYGRDRYLRELYARELYARDAYYRRYRHDPYARDRGEYEERPYTSRYSREYYGKERSSSAAGESGGEETK